MLDFLLAAEMARALCPTIPKCRRSAPSPPAKSQPGTAKSNGRAILVKLWPAICISIAWKPKEWN